MHENLTRFLIMSSNSYKEKSCPALFAPEGLIGHGNSSQPSEPRCEWLNPNEKMWTIEETLISINASLDLLKKNTTKPRTSKPESLLGLHQIVQAICHPCVVAAIGDALTEDKNPVDDS